MDTEATGLREVQRSPRALLVVFIFVNYPPVPDGCHEHHATL